MKKHCFKTIKLINKGTINNKKLMSCSVVYDSWLPMMETIYYLSPFLLIQNICCGYSKEQSGWDGSLEYPQHMIWSKDIQYFMLKTFLNWCCVIISLFLLKSHLKYYSLIRVYFVNVRYKLLPLCMAHYIRENTWTPQLKNDVLPFTS